MNYFTSFVLSLLMATLNVVLYFSAGHHWWSLVATGFCGTLALYALLKDVVG